MFDRGASTSARTIAYPGSCSQRPSRAPRILPTPASAETWSRLVEGMFEGLSRFGHVPPRATRGVAHRGAEGSPVPRHPQSSALAGRLPPCPREPREPRGLGHAPRPVVLYVHGGGFRILSKETIIMALAFARQGYLVFNINYRLLARDVFPLGLRTRATRLRRSVATPRTTWRSPRGSSSRASRRAQTWSPRSRWPPRTSAPSRGRAPCSRTTWPARRGSQGAGLLQVTNIERFRKKRMPEFVHHRLEEVTAGYLGGLAQPRPGRARSRLSAARARREACSPASALLRVRGHQGHPSSTTPAGWARPSAASACNARCGTTTASCTRSRRWSSGATRSRAGRRRFASSTARSPLTWRPRPHRRPRPADPAAPQFPQRLRVLVEPSTDWVYRPETVGVFCVTYQGTGTPSVRARRRSVAAPIRR